MLLKAAKAPAIRGANAQSKKAEKQADQCSMELPRDPSQLPSPDLSIGAQF
jgi:hypothetical protein